MWQSHVLNTMCSDAMAAVHKGIYTAMLECPSFAHKKLHNTMCSDAMAAVRKGMHTAVL